MQKGTIEITENTEKQKNNPKLLAYDDDKYNSSSPFRMLF